MATPISIPFVSFKNIVVTVTEKNGQLQPHCVERIGCSSPDTILNFQIAERAGEHHDYRFDKPQLSGDVTQFGAFTISPSGKMLTVCNSTSDQGIINITLEVYDSKAPHKRGAFDPEVANQPDGSAR